MSRRNQTSRKGRGKPSGNARQEKDYGNSKSRRRSKAVECEGTLSMTREGFAFLVVTKQNGAEPVEDIFLPARKLNGALHGDLVRVAVISRNARDGKKKEGEVVQILERSKRPYIGILQLVDKQAYVITDSKNMPFDIEVMRGKLAGAQNGEKVAILVTGWNNKNNLPLGKVLDVLGLPGENNTEMHAILAEFGLPYRFSEEVEKQAEEISAEIPGDELRQRRDFRDIPTFTIDPADAKDFDDALSIRHSDKKGAQWEVGVHIADVSYYVAPDTLIDTSAFERGNSVYLVDRTVPMLPEKLSNNLCSLRPGEEKLCFSAVFELNDQGQVLSRWFGRTVIRSASRMSYEEAQAVLNGVENVSTAGSGPVPREIREGLAVLHKLAGKLRDERFQKGAIAFERPEVKVQVDETGKPLAVIVKETIDSNWLIEEFMLLANKEVAAFVAGKKSPAFVYRVHEPPAEDKMTAFRDFVFHFGYNMKKTKTTRDYARELNKLLDKAREKPEAGGIVIMALRSMARAHYTTHNVGHYGLAFDNYTHFTSPIRRYSDLMVHRLLALYLRGGQSADQGALETRCLHLSQREQLAMDAERASIKYKMVEYMQDKVGSEFNGTISGLTEWGMYVELDETLIEGMIPVREMTDDYYVFEKESYTLTGTHTGRHFELGQRVRVMVERANLEQKQLDYKLIN